MTRLTNTMRHATLNALVDDAFRDRELRLRQREHALAVRLLRDHYGADLFERIAAIPEGWLPTTKRISFEAPPRAHGVVFLIEYAPLPAEVCHGYRVPVTMGGWLHDFDELNVARAALHEERSQLRDVVRATLASFSTVEKLAAAWPEGHRYLPKEHVTVVGSLPALRIEDVNARIAAAMEAA